MNKMTLKIAVTAFQTTDIDFTDSEFRYLGNVITVDFNEMLIHNTTGGDLYYSVETDSGDIITVNSSATQGVNFLPAGKEVLETNILITRLRITPFTSGNVYAEIYKNERGISV
jgi:hypothetical protein